VTEHSPIADVSNSPGTPCRYSEIAADARLWLLDSGTSRGATRKTVVFLHSAVGSLGTFKHQFSAFAEDGFRVLAYDRRGHGFSPARITGTAQPTSVEDLAALLDTNRITEPVHLVGAAAGGRLAADFSLAHPGRVASLTLVCSLAGVAAEIYPQGTAALLPPEFLALPPYLRELGPVYRGDNPQGTTEWRDLVEDEIPKDIVANPASWVGKPSASASANGSATPTPRGVAGLAWLTEPGGATSHGIPIHLVTGDADPYTTPSAYARLSQALPRAHFDVVTGSGHSPYWEQPEIFNAMVLRQTSMAHRQGALA
jgi:3-oxoadipate enol-lactonase